MKPLQSIRRYEVGKGSIVVDEKLKKIIVESRVLPWEVEDTSFWKEIGLDIVGAAWSSPFFLRDGWTMENPGYLYPLSIANVRDVYFYFIGVWGDDTRFFIKNGPPMENPSSWRPFEMTKIKNEDPKRSAQDFDFYHLLMLSDDIVTAGSFDVIEDKTISFLACGNQNVSCYSIKNVRYGERYPVPLQTI